MAREIVEGPDFICIGMPKAGTGWLFDQLKYHPDFWMPPVKEIGYLTCIKETVSERLEKAKLQSGKFLTWSRTGENDHRPAQFLEEAVAAADKPLNINDYAQLFRYKGTLISGDCTTSYSALAPEIIARVGERLPRTKIVFLVREPVERAWSHISMWCRNSVISEETATDPTLLSSFLRENERFSGLAYPSKIAAVWRSTAPHLQFQTFFYDGIAEDPEAVRRDILSYLGADPTKETRLGASFNKKASRKKLTLSEPIEAILVDHFRDELRSSADMFGGAAKSWAPRYGL